MCRWGKTIGDIILAPFQFLGERFLIVDVDIVRVCIRCGCSEGRGRLLGQFRMCTVAFTFSGPSDYLGVIFVFIVFGAALDDSSTSAGSILSVEG